MTSWEVIYTTRFAILYKCCTLRLVLTAGEVGYTMYSFILLHCFVFFIPTSFAAFADQFREGKAFLHLKLNLAKSYKQEAFHNYTHSVMET